MDISCLTQYYKSMKSSKGSKEPPRGAVKFYVLIALGLILVFMPLVSLLVDPLFILMKYYTRIGNGTNVYNTLRQENPGAYVHVYVFNITNAEAFLSGDDRKLRVEEVGPFTYREYRVNEKFELDEEAGVMRYLPRITTKFVPSLSVADPRTLNVTVPNIAMLAMASMVASQGFIVKTSFNLLMTNLKSEPIINLDVHSYLWGYDEPLITLGNTVLPGWITFPKLGLLDRLYDQSLMPLLEVSITDEEKFKVKKMNGCGGFKMWGYENPSKRTRCNTLVDSYEGYAYPPGITKDTKIRLYRNIFCRSLDLEYVETISTETSPVALVYNINNQTYSKNADTECLCSHDACVDGVTDLSPCLYGLGVGLSNAHFLYADPKTYERIDGINPSLEKHDSRFVVDRMLGVVLDTLFLVQVNVMVKNVDFKYTLKPFSDLVVPLGYFKVKQEELDEKSRNEIKSYYNFYPYIFHGVETITFIIGLTMVAYAVRQAHCHLLNASKVTEHFDKTLQVEIPLMDEKNHVIIQNGHFPDS